MLHKSFKFSLIKLIIIRNLYQITCFLIVINSSSKDMHSDEESLFYEMQPGASGITLSHTNHKSSVLCPETQNITSQYLALQQLDAHQKMVSRAKGVVDTSAPKSMHSYISVSSQQKRKMMKQLKNNPHDNFPSNVSDDFNGASSSRLGPYYSEEDESTDVPLHNKGIQTGIPVSNFTCKTAEKISWYLEALSLGELQSDYFTFHNHNCNHAKQLQTQQGSGKQGKKKIIKGDIMDWHREHFMEPKKPFSPRLLDNPAAKSKVRDMRCYNPPFRKKKIKSSQSSDTFESYDEDENEESSQVNANHKSSDLSSGEEETLINKRITDDAASHYSHHSSIPLMPPYRRDYSSYTDPSFLNRTEEEKYLDFLSKVTEDILRSGVFSDKAIRQAFEFHMKFYKDDPNKEKLQSLLDQVLEGLKVTNDDEENFQPRNSFLFSLSRPNSPPEKEISGNLSASDINQTASDLNVTVDESVNDKESENS